MWHTVLLGDPGDNVLAPCGHTDAWFLPRVEEYRVPALAVWLYLLQGYADLSDQREDFYNRRMYRRIHVCN